MKKKNRLFILFMILGVFFFNHLYGTQTYRLETPGYHIQTTPDGFHKIMLPGYHSAGLPGYPDLPVRLYRAAVPPEVNLKSINVRFANAKITNLGAFDIREIAPDQTRADGKMTLGDKADIYEKNDFFPSNCVEYAGFSRLRKWRIVTFKYSPFSYNPVTKELKVIAAVDVTIDYQKGERSRTIEHELSDSLMDSRVAKLVMNYRESLNWYRPGKSSGDLPAVTYDYVIVTTNAIESASAMLAGFVDHLVAKGFSPLVITEDEFGGLTGQAPDGRAEKIRKWLQDNYVAFGIEYVLLVGSPDPDDPSDGGDTVGDIPMKMCWPRYGSGSYEESPTDAFYADLTGNWDLDGDLYFGEWSDFTGSGGVDFANEVYVGRIPVYSGVTELDSILTKIIAYGTSTDTAWRSSALLPMSFSTATYDGAPLAEQMMDDYLDTAGYSSWTMYQQGSGACGANSIYAGDEELRGGTVVRDRWAANDYGLVVWWGHGSAAGAMVGYDGCWDGNLMYYTYAPDLDNDHPSIVYQNSCYNGVPENSLNLQYALLKNGGVGTVAAGRVSWFNAGVGYGSFDGSTTNSGIGYEFASRIVAEDSAGKALCDTKASMTPEMNTRLMNFYDFNLYGDPSTSIAKIDPAITVISPNGGETLKLGKTRDITWSHVGLGDNIHIVLKQNSTNVALLAKNIDPTPGTFSWTVGDCLKGAVAAGDNYRILIVEKGFAVLDVSDGYFSIEPSITVTAPDGGENWTYGTIETITWDGFGLSDNIHIVLQQNGVNVALIAKSIDPSPGAYSWRIGDCIKGSVTVGANYRIMIVQKNSTVTDKSNADFTIISP